MAEPADPQSPADADPALAETSAGDAATPATAPTLAMPATPATPPAPATPPVPVPATPATAPTLAIAAARPSQPSLFADLVLADTRIGRYVVERELGRGGMGVVYLAQDDDLKRPVVIKLVRPELFDPEDAHGTRARLLREAQAMAQVSHPNVVRVFDVGTHDEQVFIAMEFVEGADLAAWLKAEPRTPAEVLDIFVAAGCGLAAAHRAGLIHRDFKPHNVLVGADGSVKVTDFGLARAEHAADASTDAADAAAGAHAPSHSGNFLVSPLTRAGAQVGTPAYMAPEQIRGAGVDARSDQFSFCVALWEAMFGERPFAGETLPALFDSVTTGRRRKPVVTARVPAHIWAALERGLAAEPDQRFPTMDELLAALIPPRRSPRKTTIIVAAVCAAGIAAAAGVTVFVASSTGGELCGGAEQELADVWDEARKSAIERAFRASGRPDAPAAFAAFARAADRLADGYVAMQREACEATHVKKTQTEAVMDLRMACLRQKRARLAALIDIVGKADADAIASAPQAALAVGGVEACADVVALSAPVAPPEDPDVRRKVDDLRNRLAISEAQLGAGKLDESLATAQAAVTAAAPLAYAPLVAEAQLALGEAQLGLMHFKPAQDALDAAAQSAETGKHDSVRARAQMALVRAVRGQGNLDEALFWGRTAAGTLQRLGGDRVLLGELESNIAEVHRAKGDAKAAAASYARTLELLGKDPRGARVAAVTHADLGQFYLELRDFDRAYAEIDQSRAAFVELVGAEHPEIVAKLGLMASIRIGQRRADDAATLVDQALALHAKCYGPDHPMAFGLYATRGQAQQAQGKLDDAIASARKAADLAAKQFGPGHPNHASMVGALAFIYNGAERWNEAAAVWKDAVAMVEAFHKGKPHEDLIIFNNGLGFSLMKGGRHDEALAAHKRALAVVEKLQNPDSQQRAETLTRIGQTENARGRAAAALAPLEKAMAMHTAAKATPFLTSWTKFELAKARWDTNRDRPGALKLAREARVEAGKAGNTKKQQEIEAWLKKR